MIKVILTLVVMSLVISSAGFAQDTDSAQVDVRKILNNQILEVKAKQAQQKTDEDLIKVNTVSKAAEPELSNSNLISVFQKYLDNDLSVKIYIMIEVIMLVGLLYLWNNKARKNKRRKIEILKNNIKRLREEQIGSIGENNLSQLRGSLRFNRIITNDNGKDITFKARKNNIGKGEIHLAAKIQILAGEYK